MPGGPDLGKSRACRLQMQTPLSTLRLSLGSGKPLVCNRRDRLWRHSSACKLNHRSEADSLSTPQVTVAICMPPRRGREHAQLAQNAETALGMRLNINMRSSEKAKGMHSPGIEPGSGPWQGPILPLDQECSTPRSVSRYKNDHFSAFITRHELGLPARKGSCVCIHRYVQGLWEITFRELHKVASQG